MSYLLLVLKCLEEQEWLIKTLWFNVKCRMQKYGNNQYAKIGPLDMANVAALHIRKEIK